MRAVIAKGKKKEKIFSVPVRKELLKKKRMARTTCEETRIKYEVERDIALLEKKLDKKQPMHVFQSRAEKINALMDSINPLALLLEAERCVN